MSKCVHKGCGKKFSDPQEPCVYHPGPPIFHEGQKGWKCCKPRVLTFEEFLAIPPCTTGMHSTVDDTPEPETKPSVADVYVERPNPISDQAVEAALAPPPPRIAHPTSAADRALASPAPPESDSDDPADPVPSSATCKRRGCNVTSDASNKSRENEQCVYHPGQALFHEGSKGWTCCKKRVLEFDEFMKIPGCKTRDRHCFVGKRQKKKVNGETGKSEIEQLTTVRHDFYQTSTIVHASFYLKKIDKSTSKVTFSPSGEEVELDLTTTDSKHYAANVPLFGKIDTEKSAVKILGTKLELTLAKTDGAGWPVLRSDEKNVGGIIQTGRAGRA